MLQSEISDMYISRNQSRNRRRNQRRALERALKREHIVNHGGMSYLLAVLTSLPNELANFSVEVSKKLACVADWLYYEYKYVMYDSWNPTFTSYVRAFVADYKSIMKLYNIVGSGQGAYVVDFCPLSMARTFDALIERFLQKLPFHHLL